MKLIIIATLALNAALAFAESRISVENDYQARVTLLSHYEVQRAIRDLREVARKQDYEINSSPNYITSEVLKLWTSSIEQKHKIVFSDQNDSSRNCSVSMYILWSLKNKTIQTAKVLMRPSCSY